MRQRAAIRHGLGSICEISLHRVSADGRTRWRRWRWRENDSPYCTPTHAKLRSGRNALRANRHHESRSVQAAHRSLSAGSTCAASIVVGPTLMGVNRVTIADIVGNPAFDGQVDGARS